MGFSSTPTERASIRFVLLFRLGTLFGSVLLASYHLYRIPQIPREGDFTAVTLAWLFSILLFTLGILGPIKFPRVGMGFRATRESIGIGATLAAILLFALFLRLWHLGSIPFVLSGDEGSFGQEAVRVIQGETRNPFTTGFMGFSTLGFFLQSVPIRFFGPTEFGVRFLSPFIGTATVLVSFLLARRLGDQILGLATAFLVATYHFHIHFSRIALNNVWDPLLLGLALLFLVRALDLNRNADWLLTGLACGFSLGFYTGARFTCVAVLLILAYGLVLERGEFVKRNLKGMGILFGSFAVTAAPTLEFALRSPEIFNGRINQVGIFQSGWIEKEMVIRQSGMFPILLDQFKRSVLAFNLYPEKTIQYGLPSPLLDPVFGTVFGIGLLYATALVLVSKKGRDLFPMVVWWWGVTIFGGMLTETPPQSPRLFSLAVPTCFFVALPIWGFSRWAAKKWGSIASRWLLIGAVAGFAVLSLKTYFLDFSPKRISGGPHAELVTELIPLFDRLGSSHRFYFFGPPEMFWNFPSIPFAAPNAIGRDILEPLRSPPPPEFIDRTQGAVFIFLPGRKEELGFVRKSFPNGKIRAFYSPVRRGLLGVVYIYP